MTLGELYYLTLVVYPGAVGWVLLTFDNLYSSPVPLECQGPCILPYHPRVVLGLYHSVQYHKSSDIWTRVDLSNAKC